MNAHSEASSTLGSKSRPAASGAASTRTFFTHCLGRIARSHAGSTVFFGVTSGRFSVVVIALQG